MASPNHYEVLGLSPTASTPEIEHRCQELTSLYGSDGSQAPMMKLIEEARRVLTNSALREIYDSGLRPAQPPSLPESLPLPDATVPEVILNAQHSPSEAIPQPPPLEITRAMPAPEQERTTIVSTGTAPASVPAGGLPDERRLAKELAQRGVSGAEVERLLAMGRGDPPPGRKGSAPVSPELELPPSEAYVPKPTISLPPFRKSSTEERQQADRMLTGANISRRRGQFAEAERECRSALELIPGDAAALELYGDILQAVGRVDDALYAYHRATESDAGRKTAEKKYAELMLLQNREIDLLRMENIPRSASLAVILSAVFPGAGQIYNGDILKGLVIGVIVSSCIYLLGWSPYGFHKGLTSISGPLVFFLATALIAYGYALVDANLSARRGKRQSGWDV
jgi:tetratricopeptide (TPR) repeat protein